MSGSYNHQARDIPEDSGSKKKPRRLNKKPLRKNRKRRKDNYNEDE